MITMAAFGRLLPQKNMFFSSSILFKEKTKIKVARTILKNGQFIVLAPGVYHGELNFGYNVAKRTNFADLSWQEVGRVTACNRKRKRPFIECTVPVKMTLWKEALLMASSEMRMSPSEYQVRS